MKNLPFFLFIILGLACNTDASKSSEQETQKNKSEIKTYATTGHIERLGPKIDQLIPTDAKLEILADGFDWTEGPLWLPKVNKLLFSDIPPNKIYQWSAEDGLKDYLHPSGYTGAQPRGGEPGSNGLLLDKAGKLVLCQHGDRRMARMDAPLDQPAPKFATIIDKWESKRFNSPNDAVYDSQGNLYFTDPPYGLLGQMDDPAKEIPFQGVYRFSNDGKLSLLTKDMSRPNGIALSPDEKILYVANSDHGKAVWMAYDLKADGQISNERIFFDATNRVGKEKGLPDGLKVDNDGNLWATGPGGVLVFSPEGEHLGTIKTGQATSNCAFNADKTVLYITADMYLLRLKLG